VLYVTTDRGLSLIGLGNWRRSCGSSHVARALLPAALDFAFVP
jgi:hypothetical protein